MIETTEDREIAETPRRATMLRKLIIAIAVAGLMGIAVAAARHKDKNDDGRRDQKDANEDRRERNKDAREDLKEHQKAEKHDLKKHHQLEKRTLKQRQNAAKHKAHRKHRKHQTPPGWSKGRKVGWNGKSVPPGQRKSR
jgi:hypothetical protein